MGPFPTCGTGVTRAGTPASAAKRSACASALSGDAYAASWMVQPRVSRRAATAFRGALVVVVEGAEVFAVVGAGGGGGGAAGGATNDSRARASSAHPPTAKAATTSAAMAPRRPRRGPSATGTSTGGGDTRGPDGNQRSRTTPSNGTSRSIENSAFTPSGASTSTPSGAAESCTNPAGGSSARSSAPSERNPACNFGQRACA